MNDKIVWIEKKINQGEKKGWREEDWMTDIKGFEFFREK